MAQSFSVKAVLQAIDENFTSTTNKAMQMMNKLGATSDSVSNKVAKGGNTTTSTFKSVASAIGVMSLGTAALGAISNGISDVYKGLSETSATWQTFNGNMAYIGKSSGEIAKVRGELTKFAQQTIYSASDMASTYSQLAAVGTKNTTKLVKGFGGLAAASENPQQAMKTLSEQATQMAAKPMVQWQDFRLMLEQTPAGIAAVAKTMGMSTSELIKNVQDGKVKTEDFFNAIAKAGTNANFSKMATQYKTVGQAMDGLKETATNALLPTFDKIGSYGIKAISGIINYLDGINPQALAQSVGSAVDSVINVLSTVFNFINQNKDWLGPLAVSVVTFIGAFKGVQAAASGISSLITGFQNLQAFVQIVAGAKNSLSAFFTLLGLNPWVVLIAGIAAVVAGLVWFFTQTKTGQKLWQGFTQFLSNAWQGLVSIAQSVWSSITSFFSSLWQGIVSVAQSVWGSIVSVFTTAWNGFIQAVSPIIDAFKNLWNSLTEFFTVLWQGIVSVAKTIWSGLSAFFSTIWQGIVAVATPIWNGLVAVITTVWNIIKIVVQTGINVISTVIQSVMTVIQAIWSAVWNVISTVAQTVWNMITTAVQTGITMISSIIQATLTIIQTVWSTIWNVIVTVVQTVWNMVVTVISTAINVVAGIIQAVTQAIQGNWSAVWNTIVSVATTVWNGIKSVVSAGINGVKSVITTVMNGLKSVISTVWNTIKSIFNAGVNFIKSVVHIDLGAQGRAIMDSFLNGLKSAWEAVKSFVGGIGNWIKEHKGPIRVDRKLLIPAGIAIMTGFNKGLQNQFSVVQKGVSNMAGAVSDAVSSNLETITVPSPNTRDFMNTMNALQSANQNLYRQHSVGFGGTFSDNLTIDSPTMAQENNNLLRKLADKQQDIYLDGNVLVGSTYDRYDNRLGNRVNLKGRWS
ncbi:phage tail protein [Ligilactobacillus salivarius]|uniref:phage tail protein n=1 Tax=Ligilactobacillus salivarius TaxID=1624 RepID=UPI003F8BC40D